MTLNSPVKHRVGTYLVKHMLSLYKAPGSVPSIKTKSCCLRILFYTDNIAVYLIFEDVLLNRNIPALSSGKES